LKHLLTAALLLCISGCSAAPLIKEPPVPEGSIETLQGAVAISLATPDGKTSGNGIFIYRRPDSFRLTILAPFGQSIIDIVINGETVLYISESKKKAWRGSVRDLPEWLGMRIWPLMRWVIEPAPTAGPALERTFTRPDGTGEKIFYDAAGFVRRKVNAFGDEVIYRDYLKTNGVTVPQAIEIKTAEGSGLSLVFDEPEVNLPVNSDVLAPATERYEVLPLTGFKGF
jgi:hypothetical protein